MSGFEIFGIFNIPKRILKGLGLWTTKDTTIAYRIYGVIMHLIFLDIYSILMGMYLTKFENLIDFAELMSIWPIYVSAAIKTVNFMVRIDEIEELFGMIENCLKDYEITEKFKRNLKTVDVIYKIFWGGASCIVVNMIISNIFFHKLGLKMWFPYEINTRFRFWSAAFYQNFDGFCYAAANMTIDTLVVFFMCYIIGLLELLCDKLENLKKIKTPKHQLKLKHSDVTKEPPKVIKNKEKLLKCINSHLKIIEITRKVENLFTVFIFIEGLFGVIVICTTAYVLTIISPSTQFVPFIQNIFMLMTWFLQILLPCYYSERIQTISMKLSDSLFYSDWMYEDREYRVMMKFFMENTKKPLKISALGIFDVDLQTFMRIGNSAYSLYAVFKKSK